MPFKIKKTVSSLAPSGNSVLFNGSNQSLSVANNSAFQFGTGDFTIEGWIYSTSSKEYGILVGRWGGYAVNGNSSYAIRQGAAASQKYQFGFTTNGSTDILINALNTFSLNTWYHLAAVRNGTTFTFYVNGVSQGTTTNANAVFAGTTNLTVGGANNNTDLMNGYASNVRLVKGTALYTSNFTPPTAPITAIANTSLLTCNAATIVDGSSNNFTITNNNTATVSSAVTPFSSTFSPFKIKKNNPNFIAPTNYSVAFNGSNQYLTVPSNSAFQFGTGDFTIECWVYLNTLNANTTILRMDSGNGFNGILFGHGSPAGVYITSTGSSWDIIGGGVFTGLTTGTWTHLSLTRNGSTFRGFVNGTVVFTATSASSIYQLSPIVRIGCANSDGTYAMNGYISNVRILKGTALYTASFSVPTAPLTAIANTSLLTCNAPTIVDASSNNFTITNNNGATVSSTITPFSASVSNGGFKLKQVSYVRPNYMVATGGDLITTSGSYKIHTFTTVGTSSFTISNLGNNPSIEYLVVGGGGGGGYVAGAYDSRGGGGGAGGFRTGSISSGFAISNYSVVVGSGGSLNNNGQDSSFLTVTSLGGGGGGFGSTAAKTGGSGGGGGAIGSGGNFAGAAGTAGQGNSGGGGGTDSSTYRYGGGGGGAGSVGVTAINSSTACVGGSGSYSNITGTNTPYAGGGGGGQHAGGIGGGGAGTTTGSANTGGGGGGGFTTYQYVNYPGGAGGSGVVVIKYRYTD